MVYFLNQNKTRQNIAITLIILFLLSFVCIPVSAGLRVYGIQYVAELAPGTQGNHNMLVTLTNSQDARDITINVTGLGQQLDGQFFLLKQSEDTSPFSASRFITIDNPSFHLKPYQEEQVNALIAVPRNVGDGGRYAIITVSSAPVGNIATSINIPVMITITGSDIRETGEITGITFSDQEQGKLISVYTVLKNTGNHHYKGIQNEIRIRDVSGNLILNQSTLLSYFSIIPGYSVQFENRIETPLEPGTYTVSSRMVRDDGRVLDEKSESLTVKEVYIPPLTSVSIIVRPSEQAILKAPDGSITISFPEGSVFSDVNVVLRAITIDQLTDPPKGYLHGSTAFSIDGLPGLLAKDATIEVRYTERDLQLSEGNNQRMILAYLDTGSKTWVTSPTEIKERDKILVTTSNHPGTWAILIKPKSETQAKKGLLPVNPVIPLLAVIIIMGFFGRRLEMK